MELTNLKKILKTDQHNINMNGGSKVGLIIGLILSLGAVAGAFFYIKKIRKPQFIDYDEGGEVEDHFYAMM